MTTVAQSLTKASPLELGGAIRTPQEFAERIRGLSAQAHILSPAMAVSEIPAHYTIQPAVVVIDSQSTDVYKGSFHKSKKVGDDYIPLEVSLSKTGLLKIMAAAGVNVTRSERTDDNRTPYYWTWCSEGTITDFGAVRQLPPGNSEVDLRDGSPQVGEWTPEEWAKREAAAAEKRAKTAERDRWKVKPEAIGGWSRERLMQARSYGLRLAESKSLTALIRNLGLPQKFAVEDLAKPFVVFRTVFHPDMSIPGVAEIVTAAHFGSMRSLYPGSNTATAKALPETTDAPAGDFQTDSAAADLPLTTTPVGAVELDDIPAAEAPAAAAVTYQITKVSKLAIDGADWYFFDTTERVTFVSPDVDIARGLNDARKASRRLVIESKAITLNGVEFREVVEATGPAANGLPSPEQL